MRNKKHRMIIATEILLAIAVLVAAFSTDAVVSKAAYQSQPPQNNLTVGTKLEVRLVETRTVQYVDRLVTEVKYLERIVKVPAELRSFSSLEEMEQWLGNNRQTTTLYLQSQDATIDCDDYALELQQGALADGYILSFEIIAYNEYNLLFKNPIPVNQSLHAINLAIIGNNAYYIEPQTGEVVFASFLD